MHVIVNALRSYSRRSHLVRAGFVMGRVDYDIFGSFGVMRWPTRRVRFSRVYLRTNVGSKRWSARTSPGVGGRLLP